jgi:ribonuclease J
MKFLDTETPIYIGQVSLDLINSSKLFLGEAPINKNFQIIEPWKWITIAENFGVKSFLVDHSSPEAFAFLIEADGKRIFYSGDFRASGNKKVLYENLIKTPPENIDLLLIEGTMVGRNNQVYPTEKDVEKALYNIIKGQRNVSFVVSSAQNIDRFISVFKACRKSNKQVVLDIYNAWILDMVKKKSPNLPSIDWDGVLVFNHPNQIGKIEGKEFNIFRKRVEMQSIGHKVFDQPENFVYFLRCPSIKLIDNLRKHGKINIIYSQWEGYLHEEHKTYCTDRLNKLKNDNDIIFTSIHTSGHATLKELKELAVTLKPQKIVPIHTEYPKEFKMEFEKVGIKGVDNWEDGKEYKL